MTAVASVAATVRTMLAKQAVRFVLVGGVNTVFSYAVFVVLHLTVGRVVPYLLVLVLSYPIGVSEAFVMQRWLVFRSTTAWFPAYLRFWSVYLVAMGLNLVLLSALVELVEMPILVAQSVALAIIAGFSFLANRHFSFRVPGASSERREGEISAPPQGPEGCTCAQEPLSVGRPPAHS